MSDKRFDEVVIEAASTNTRDYLRAYKACCSDCGTYHQVDVSEFEHSFLVGAEIMGYVAKMRAWNCCNEGAEPLDGFPEGPDSDFAMRAAE